MRIISAAFHPLLIPSYLFGVIIRFQPSLLSPYNKSSYNWLWMLVTITTFVIPTISVLLLRLTRNISSLQLTERKERLLPFTFITFFYIVTSYMFIVKLSISHTVATMMVSTTLLVGLLTLITSKYKISIHSAGIWGATGFVLAISLQSLDGDLSTPLAIVVMAAGLVNAARLYLNIHSPAQVIYGSLLGFLICFFSLYYLG